MMSHWERKWDSAQAYLSLPACRALTLGLGDAFADVSIATFPIDDISERLALEMGPQIVAEEIDGAMTVLITGRRDMRRD